MKLFTSFLSSAALSLFACMHSSAQIISTIAGNGTAGFSGDFAVAAAALLNGPYGIAADNAGNLYIADRNNNRLRKVTPLGFIVTIAGNGIAGYSLDGVAATISELNDPVGVAISPSGDIYIADRGNNRIRMLNSGGVISTIAGTGTAGYSGDGGTAAAAQINNPRGLCFDTAGNLYISDQENHRVRKVDVSGIITTVAGTGTMGYSGDGGAATAAELSNPYGIATDRSGNLYIADADNERVRKVSAAGIITTIAGNGTAGYSGDGGPATSAMLSEPLGLAADSAGNLLIADAHNNRIRRITASGNIATIAGDGTAGYSGDGGTALAAMLNNPYGVAFSDAGYIYIADYGNNCIRYMAGNVGVKNITPPVHAITVYPNPASGSFTIYIPAATQGKAILTITDAAGKTIKKIDITTGIHAPVSLHVPAGIYLLSAENADGVWTGKISISK